MPDASTATAAPAKSMEDIVALCKRRGFVFPSSEIYGGINGFWDYGPLGVELKRNLKAAWWQDIVRCPPLGPDGQPLDIVGLDSTIIMNPQVWEASGHVGGFNDPMVDCRECQSRFRADHIIAVRIRFGEEGTFWFSTVAPRGPDLESYTQKKIDALTKKRAKEQKNITNYSAKVEYRGLDEPDAPLAEIPCPQCEARGSLTEPRQFNLMFESHTGAVQDDSSKVYLRPETAQGIFANFWNVVDTSRVKVPFGIAQVGKAFRNEVTPRNFTFRSREFEQMEIEFFIPDPEVVGENEAKTREWYAYWRDQRYQWWQSIGLAGENLILREHDRDELAHYAKEGAGTSDVEYRFPFTAPGFGELEGIAHRTNFDLRQHAEHTGKGDKLTYFDQERGKRYFPHVIEPSAGADRGTLALICEAYTPDDTRPSGVYMAFHPRMAPIKAGIFPLVNKGGMPEVAHQLFMQLRQRYNVQYDAKQNIGKRYARMDEAGTPYCFTIDGDTLEDNTVTVRHRDTQHQERIPLENVEAFLTEKIGA